MTQGLELAVGSKSKPECSLVASRWLEVRLSLMACKSSNAVLLSINWRDGELGQNYSGAGQAERAEVLEHHAQTNRHRERPKQGPNKKHGGGVNSLNGSLWATGQAYPYGETPWWARDLRWRTEEPTTSPPACIPPKPPGILSQRWTSRSCSIE